MTYAYSVAYKTTAAQEQALMARADEVLASLALEGATDYEKIRAIYDYICDNVAYDYGHLEDPSYRLQFTAYAALMDGTSVCQGYASLFYLLAGKAGLDVRIVAGVGDGEAHSWNIVKLGDVWYNLDATWEAVLRASGSGAGSNYAYFLKSDADFADHARGSFSVDPGYALDYSSKSFCAAHPMATESYELGEGLPYGHHVFLGF